MEVMVSDDLMFIDGEMSYMGDMNMGYTEKEMFGTQKSVSEPEGLLSSWLFVGGVTMAVFALGVVFGLLLAKRKIKKGIDLYED